jgi:hypothetical protein
VYRGGQRQPWRRVVRALSAKPWREDRTGPGSPSDVRGRVVLMHRGRARSYRRRRPHDRGALVRRTAVTVVAVVAVALVLAADVTATLSAIAARGPESRRAATVRARPLPPPYGGEPHIGNGSSPLRRPGWRPSSSFAIMPAGAAADWPRFPARKRRVAIRLLEQAGRNDIGATADAVASVRIASAGERGCVVTSAIGNFLIGRPGWRWLVVSLPGD